MTNEQKAAFINAQFQMMAAEKEMMIAENNERESHGHSIAYGGQQWLLFIEKWEPILGHNSLIEFFYQ